MHEPKLKSENVGSLLVSAIEDVEKLLRQELDLFVAKTKEAVELVIGARVRFQWLSLCVTVSVILSAFALVEGLKTIPGMALWAAYALACTVFILVGFSGFFLAGYMMKKKEAKEINGPPAKLASVHILNEGGETYA